MAIWRKHGTSYGQQIGDTEVRPITDLSEPEVRPLDKIRLDKIETEPPNPQPGVINSKKSRARIDYDADFTIFWNKYPARNGKKDGKFQAFSEWKRLVVIPEMRDILFAALDAQKKHIDWTKENGKYVQDAVRWLKHRRWEDEIGSTANGGDRYASVKRNVA